jgi:hypothetical protein
MRRTASIPRVAPSKMYPWGRSSRHREGNPCDEGSGEGYGMGRGSRWEYFRAIFFRYREATGEGKSRILEEFCPVCGYNRKYAIRKLNGPRPGKKPKGRPPRPCLAEPPLTPGRHSHQLAGGLPRPRCRGVRAVRGDACRGTNKEPADSRDRGTSGAFRGICQTVCPCALHRRAYATSAAASARQARWPRRPRARSCPRCPVVWRGRRRRKAAGGTCQVVTEGNRRFLVCQWPRLA